MLNTCVCMRWAYYFVHKRFQTKMQFSWTGIFIRVTYRIIMQLIHNCIFELSNRLFWQNHRKLFCNFKRESNKKGMHSLIVLATFSYEIKSHLDLCICMLCENASTASSSYVRNFEFGKEVVCKKCYTEFVPKCMWIFKLKCSIHNIYELYFVILIFKRKKKEFHIKLKHDEL